MPLPVEDQFPEADASASGSSSSAPRAPREQPNTSNPQHLHSLLDMIADGDGESPVEGISAGGGIRIEDLREDDDIEDEEEQDEQDDQDDDDEVAEEQVVGSSAGKSKKKKKNKKKSKSKAVSKLKYVCR